MQNAAKHYSLREPGLTPNGLSSFRLHGLFSLGHSLLLFFSAFQEFPLFQTNRVETQRSRGAEERRDSEGT